MPKAGLKSVSKPSHNMAWLMLFGPTFMWLSQRVSVAWYLLNKVVSHFSQKLGSYLHVPQICANVPCTQSRHASRIFSVQSSDVSCTPRETSGHARCHHWSKVWVGSGWTLVQGLWCTIARLGSSLGVFGHSSSTGRPHCSSLRSLDLTNLNTHSITKE